MIEVPIEFDLGDIEDAELIEECQNRGFAYFDCFAGNTLDFVRELRLAFERHDRKRFEMLLEQALPPRTQPPSLAIDFARAEAGFGTAA